MDIEKCKLAIERSFPDFKVESVSPCQQGWDSFVVEVNGHYIFRFPPREEVTERLVIEIRILPELAKHLPVRIPQFEFVWHGDEHQPQMFVGYPKIPGEEMGKPPFSPRNPDKLAGQLGGILTELHSFPVGRATELGVKGGTSKDWEERWHQHYKWQKENVFPQVAENLVGKCAEIWEWFLLDARHFDFEARLVHHDLSCDDHILWNPETEEITGIIDWGDIRIGDPALDFTGIMYDCGIEFTEKVLAAYELPVDETFMERADWYGKLLAFHEIEYGMLGNKPWYVTRGMERLKEL